MSEKLVANSAKLCVGVVGMGAVGPVLAAALQQAGHTLVGVCSRSDASKERADAILPGVAQLPADELIKHCELVVFAVRDTQLSDLVEDLASKQVFRPYQLVAHVCGSMGLEVLEPATALGAIPLALHPAQTFSGTSLDLERLRGTHWAVNAPPALLPVAQALVYDLEGIPHTLPDTSRGLYHAALAHGANHLVTLVTQALRALAAAGVSEPAAFAEPLFKAALERSLREGESGLSGPVARGDVLTVEKHLRVLESGNPQAAEDTDPTQPYDDLSDLPSCYAEMARATALRARERQVLSEAALCDIMRVICRTKDGKE